MFCSSYSVHGGHPGLAFEAQFLKYEASSISVLNLRYESIYISDISFLGEEQLTENSRGRENNSSLSKLGTLGLEENK